MIDAVVGVGYFVVVDGGERGGRDWNERVWVFGEDGKNLESVGSVGVVNVFREIHDYKLCSGVGDVNPVRDAVFIDGGASVGGDRGDSSRWGYWTQDVGGGDGRIGTRVVDGVGDGGKSVHDVLGGAVEFVAYDFKGHILVAGRLRERMVGVTLYLYGVNDDQGGCVSGSDDDA